MTRTIIGDPATGEILDRWEDDQRLRDRVDSMVQEVTSTTSLIPTPKEFELAGEVADYLLAPRLATLAATLIDRHSTLLGHIAPLTVRYLWKRAGGASGGANVLGKCTRPGGLFRYLTSLDFVIWLAADHCLVEGLGAREVEALLFHELLHIGLDEKGRPVCVGHDFEGFVDELRIYGTWKQDLVEARLALQLSLPLVPQ